MQIKKKDTMESVDDSTEQSGFSKKVLQQTWLSNESSFMLPMLSGNSGGSGRHLSTGRPDQLHTNGTLVGQTTENQKLLCPHLYKDLYRRDRRPWSGLVGLSQPVSTFSQWLLHTFYTFKTFVKTMVSINHFIRVWGENQAVLTTIGFFILMSVITYKPRWARGGRSPGQLLPSGCSGWGTPYSHSSLDCPGYDLQNKKAMAQKKEMWRYDANIYI